MNPIYKENKDKLKYALIAFDLDGTLVDDDKKISPSAYASIMEVQKLGMTVVIASGRPTYGCRHIAKELHLDEYGGYIISYNGGKITSMRDGQVLSRNTMSLDLLRDLFEKVKDLEGVTMLSYINQAIVTNKEGNKYVEMESFVDNGMPIQVSEDFPFNLTREPFKAALVGDRDRLAPLKTELIEMYKGRLTLLTSAENFIEIIPYGVDKGAALEFLLADIGLSKENVIAVGDNYNDLRMIQLAGLGVAMANATEAVKRAANYITLSNNEDGIRHLLNKYILYPEETNTLTTDQIDALQKNTLMENLGIKVTRIEEGYVEATMPVDRRTRQPMGIIHGGANLALAETVAGYGSIRLLKNNELQYGMQVSGNHISSAHEGDTVKAEGRIIHRGRSSHVWDVEISSVSSGTLICSVRVTNAIVRKR